MDEVEVVAVSINLSDDSHMAYAGTVAASAKEHQVTGLEIAALHSLAVVHLQTGTTGEFISKLLKYIAGETRAVKAVRTVCAQAVRNAFKSVSKTEKVLNLCGVFFGDFR